MRSLKLAFIVLILPVAFLSGAYTRFLKDGEGFPAGSFSAQVVVRELADESPVAAEASELLFVGDIMLSRGVAHYIEKEGAGDYRYPFTLIADELRSADLTIGNLENPISSRGRNQGSTYSFRASPKSLDGLAFTGFDVLSLANNHMWDWGSEALTDTDTFLEEWGMKGIGAGVNYRAANDPVIVDVRGTRVAFFSYTNLYPKSLEATETRPGVSQFEPELIKERIFKVQNPSSAQTSVGKQADLVVVLLHWGEEYQTHANDFQKKFAHELIDAGADLVIGHHPHVVQEIEKYETSSFAPHSGASEGQPAVTRTGWIAYSLGNFVFDQRFSEDTKEGLMLRVNVVNGKIERVEKVKIDFTETFQPRVVE